MSEAFSTGHTPAMGSPNLDNGEPSGLSDAACVERAEDPTTVVLPFLQDVASAALPSGDVGRPAVPGAPGSSAQGSPDGREALGSTPAGNASGNAGAAGGGGLETAASKLDLQGRYHDGAGAPSTFRDAMRRESARPPTGQPGTTTSTSSALQHDALSTAPGLRGVAAATIIGRGPLAASDDTAAADKRSPADIRSARTPAEGDHREDPRRQTILPDAVAAAATSSSSSGRHGAPTSSTPTSLISASRLPTGSSSSSSSRPVGSSSMPHSGGARSPPSSSTRIEVFGPVPLIRSGTTSGSASSSSTTRSGPGRGGQSGPDDFGGSSGNLGGAEDRLGPKLELRQEGIELLRQLPDFPATVVFAVGGSRAGKSTVGNALFEEHRAGAAAEAGGSASTSATAASGTAGGGRSSSGGEFPTGHGFQHVTDGIDVAASVDFKRKKILLYCDCEGSFHPTASATNASSFGPMGLLAYKLGMWNSRVFDH